MTDVTKRYRQLMTEIGEWHKQTFPNATLAGQLAKLEEELNEFKNAPLGQRSEELADIFIVLAGLRNFDSSIGRDYEQMFIWARRIKGFFPSLVEKMEKNKQRNWKEVRPGEYHH